MCKTEVIETVCNICGNPLKEEDPQDGLAIHRRFGYGSIHDDEEHKVQFCQKCFDTLIESCNRPTAVNEYVPAKSMSEYIKTADPDDPVPGEFCDKCGGTMNYYDLQEKLTIKASIGEQQHRVQFCCDCFDKIIDDCKHPSLVKDWGV